MTPTLASFVFICNIATFLIRNCLLQIHDVPPQFLPYPNQDQGERRSSRGALQIMRVVHTQEEKLIVMYSVYILAPRNSLSSFSWSLSTVASYCNRHVLFPNTRFIRGAKFHILLISRLIRQSTLPHLA
jgi:hypothetical protein